LLDNLQISQAIAAFQAAARLDRRRGAGLAVATIAAAILNDMRQMDNAGRNRFQCLPMAERIEICTPLPRNALEQKATHLAQAALERIIALHRGSGPIQVTL